MAFLAALAMVLGVMVFFTVRVLEFERSMAEAQAQAALEENVRLALWRMDSAAAVLLKDEEEPVRLAANPNMQQQSGHQQQQQGGGISQRFDQLQQTMISQQEFQQRQAVAQPAPREEQAWKSIEPQLLDRIADILPGAHLEAVGKENAGDESRRLASIPARLVVPTSAMPDWALPWNTPLRVSLMVAWVCVVMAAGAVAWLLSGTLALSKRRGDFASAVTHELRTPLTTLRMYAEMLSAGMVAEEPRRGEYLRTLVAETDRLGRLIENVLAYSRLENRLRPRHAETVSVGQILEQALPTLRRRAEQDGLVLGVEVAADASAAVVRTDTVGVQQILLNLVDNACKHGKPPISLAVRVREGRAEFVVSDEGPGLAAGVSPFTAFGKAKSDPAPGIGLGLFLSRQIAREMGGELEYRGRNVGVEFVLGLPV
jgi:signal transduction histidine kinase